MSLGDQLLAALVVYGLPVLFGVILVAALGLPLPDGLLLVAAGSFVKQGAVHVGPVLIVGTLAQVSGDVLGYGLARWVGRRALLRLGRRVGAEDKLKKLAKLTRHWGWVAIFFSRWLVTALAPWINLTCGIADYPWPLFLLWDLLGSALWVSIWVALGYFFSDRVQAVADVIGNLPWVFLGLLIACVLGWQLVRAKRES